MSPEADKVTLCDATTHQHGNETVLSFFDSVWVLQSTQIQIIIKVIKTESASFSWTNVAYIYVVIFPVQVPG